MLKFLVVNAMTNPDALAKKALTKFLSGD